MQRRVGGGRAWISVAAVLAACSAAAGAEGAAAAHAWAWRRLAEPKGVPRLCYESAAAYDTSVDKLVLFGGHGLGYSGHQRADTWLYDPKANTWTLAAPLNRPIGACCVREMVYDRANRRTYYFGGHSYNHGWQWRAERLRGGGVPWAYDAKADTWTCPRPPVSKRGAPWTGAAYDDEHQVVVTYGGENFYDKNVWVYDGYANTWTWIKRAGKGPDCGGHVPPMAYDSERRLVLMYGHGYLEARRNDLWAYDLKQNAWTALEAAVKPPLRGGSLMVHDPLNRTVVVFSPGEKHLSAFAYDWSKKTWEALPTGGTAPPPYTVSQGAYDPVRHQTIFANGGSSGVRNRPANYLCRHARPAAGSSVLPAPGSVRVTATEAGAPHLAFDLVEGAVRYAVYTGTAKLPWQVTYEKAAEIGKPPFAGTALARGTVQYFYVRAVDAKGVEGEPSLKVRTQPRPPTTPVVSVLDKGRVEIAWATSPATDIVGYNLYTFAERKRVSYGVQPVGLKKLNATPLTETTFVQTTTVPVDGAIGPYYLVRAVDRLGVEGGPSPWSTTYASAPRGLSVQCKDGMARLTWRANPEKGIAGYNVYRKDSKRGLDAKQLAGPVKAPRYVDASKTDDSPCKYYVVAVDALGRTGHASHGAWLNDDGRQ